MEECIARENLGQACRSTRHFGLHKEFPTVERDYQEHVLARLIARQQWQAALTACNDDEVLQVRQVTVQQTAPQCRVTKAVIWRNERKDVSMMLGSRLAQVRLVQAMLLAGEAGLAMEFATMLQLPASVMHVEPSVLAEQALHRTRTYLQLPLPRTSMLQGRPHLLSHFCVLAHAIMQLYDSGRSRPSHLPVQVSTLWTPRNRSSLPFPCCRTALSWVWTVSGSQDLKQALGLASMPHPQASSR